MQGLSLEVVSVFDSIVTIWTTKKSEQSSLHLTLMGRHHRVQSGTECQVYPSLLSSHSPLPYLFCGTIVV